jgi:hypothetical protein
MEPSGQLQACNGTALPLTKIKEMTAMRCNVIKNNEKVVVKFPYLS